MAPRNALPASSLPDVTLWRPSANSQAKIHSIATTRVQTAQINTISFTVRSSRRLQRARVRLCGTAWKSCVAVFIETPRSQDLGLLVLAEHLAQHTRDLAQCA